MRVEIKQRSSIIENFEHSKLNIREAEMAMTVVEEVFIYQWNEESSSFLEPEDIVPNESWARVRSFKPLMDLRLVDSESYRHGLDTR